MIYTNDEIADLIQQTIKLMIELESFVNTEEDHHCDYRTIYRTHKLLVDKVLETLGNLTNETVSIRNINPRDLVQALNELKVSGKTYSPPSGSLYKKIGDRNGANHREEGY